MDNDINMDKYNNNKKLMSPLYCKSLSPYKERQVDEIKMEE